LLTQTDVLQLIQSPPKDLMDVFKKALERIVDSRYGKTVFQLVAAARRPLTLAELRISLHVKPGISDWSLLDLPQDERAIITLCGGGLLEMDEETDTVHFIHHSVYQYLTGEHLDRSDYHFSITAADIALGMRCVTYLAYSIFDTALTTSAKPVVVDTSQLAEQMKQLAKRETGLASAIVTAIRRRPGSSNWHNANIGRTIQRVLESKVEAAEVLAFSDYAHENWAWHATHPFLPSSVGAQTILQRIVLDPPEHIKRQLPKDHLDDGVRWAGKHQKLGILFTLILSRSWSLRSAAELQLDAVLTRPPSGRKARAHIFLASDCALNQLAQALPRRPSLTPEGLEAYQLERCLRRVRTMNIILEYESNAIMASIEAIRESMTAPEQGKKIWEAGKVKGSQGTDLGGNELVCYLVQRTRRKAYEHRVMVDFSY